MFTIITTRWEWFIFNTGYFIFTNATLVDTRLRYNLSGLIRHSKSPYDKTLSCIKGIIAAHLYIVKKNIRDVAGITIPIKYKSIIISDLKKDNIHFFVREKSEKYCEIFLMKSIYLLDIIKFVEGGDFNMNIVKKWVAGKMYGFPSNEITKYIKQTNDCMSRDNSEIFYCIKFEKIINLKLIL